MAKDGRADRLLRVVREEAGVAPSLRVSAAVVDGSGGPLGGGGTHTAASSAPPFLTYGAVVFNDESGAAERELAALGEEEALARVAAAAREFGVVVSALDARVGSRRRGW
jgi:hypothetical protein